MRQQFDRYFELLPLLLMIVIVLVAEFQANSRWQQFGLGQSKPRVEAPRMIFR